MSFRVVEGEPKLRWVAGDGTSTYYIGQLLSYITTTAAATPGTVIPMLLPNGAADTTNKQVVAGVVVGFNNRAQTSNSTGQYDGGTCVAQATQLARDWMFQEGMYVKGDPQVLIQMAEVTPETMIEGDIRNAAVGTATTLLTATAGSTDGCITAMTTNACDFTPVANKCTIYCRTGANAGIYRHTVDISTTAPAVTVAFPYDTAIGDTFVRVPFKQGFSAPYIGGPGLYLTTAIEAAANTNFHIIISSLDLSTASKEVARFRFCTTHFDLART